ncbi:hypothetical protein TBH_P109 (plasmid) [Thiolapillus brandeum]|uniref:Uncharacterized protein n=1 Tax=Thiolapillus brandeum TaxID=1076588 RepID=A0A7U6JJ04_9GAMM|nr:hypothetical protein TBH_P109 [Thiolapillus brandeum]
MRFDKLINREFAWKRHYKVYSGLVLMPTSNVMASVWTSTRQDARSWNARQKHWVTRPGVVWKTDTQNTRPIAAGTAVVHAANSNTPTPGWTRHRRVYCLLIITMLCSPFRMNSMRSGSSTGPGAPTTCSRR